MIILPLHPTTGISRKTIRKRGEVGFIGSYENAFECSGNEISRAERPETSRQHNIGDAVLYQLCDSLLCNRFRMSGHSSRMTL